MEKTYLFYDIETSGLNKCFDQIFQFAAVRTDLELNELERYNILIKPNPDVIPAPKALITHQISLQKLQNEGMREIKAINLIYEMMTKPGTISLGYNSLNFDDEFIRFSFYRNLLPPYAHQYANGCGRIDIYPITAIFYLFKPEVLNWPKINEITSFKLENLSAANKFTDRTSHDALTDVENTLKLAKIFHKEQQIWHYLCHYFNKDMDLQRINKLEVVIEDQTEPYQIGLLIDGSFGYKKNYQIPALNLGFHHHYKNQTLWLPLDSPALSQTNRENIASNTMVIRKKLGEPPIVLPFIFRYMNKLSEERKELVQKNILWLTKNSDIFQGIMNYHKEYTYPKVPNLDIDASLYQDGFPSDYEKILGLKFNHAFLPQQIELLEKFSPKMRSQAIRILGRNYYDLLPENLKQEFDKYLQVVYSNNENEMPADYRNEKRLTIQKALDQIQILKTTENLTASQINILDELANYLHKNVTI
jgi:exodeoxyribonuclease-1